MPFYNFEKNSITHRNVKNLQSVLYISLAILGTLQGLYYRFFFYLESFSLLYLIVSFVKEFFVVMSPISAIAAASFRNHDNWLRLTSNLQYIDKIFKNNQASKFNKFTIYLQLFFYMSIYVIYFFHAIFVYTSKTNVARFKMFWVNECSFFIDSVTYFLIFSLALALHSRYYQLNCLFDQNNISFHQLQKIEQVSRILSEGVQSYNAIFGWSLLFSSGKCVTHLLQWFLEILYLTRGSVYSPFNLIITSCFAVYTLVSIIFDSVKLKKK